MVQFAFPHELQLTLQALLSILQYVTKRDSLALNACR